MRIGLIRVMTLEDESLLNIHGKLIEECFDNVTVISRCIEDQPEGIHDEKTEREAIPKIIKLGSQFKNIDALIVSCCADPGVKELRRRLRIPVIGSGSSATAVALSYGDKIGVLSLKEPPKVIVDILGNRIVGVVAPRGVRTALDLMNPEIRKEVLKSAKELAKTGAEVILPACSGFSTFRLCQEIEKKTGIITVDPVIASGLMALYGNLTKRDLKKCT